MIQLTKNATYPDGAFYIDASSLEGRFMKCPKSYFYNQVCKRETSKFPAGRTFGGIVHDHLLAPYYRGERVNVLAACDALPPEMSDDYRNAGYLCTFWQRYLDTYSREFEPFEIEKFNDGKLAVELPFAVEIGQLYGNHTTNDIPIVWIGRMDMVISWPGGTPSPMDHKTSSIGGEGAWDEYANSTQQIGYVWALQKLLEVPVNEFTINLLLTRKLTANGKGIEFFRQRFSLDQDIVQEFPERILAVVCHLFDCYTGAYWPMHTSQCKSKFGACEYLDVCKSAPGARLETLATGMYKDVTWSPLAKATP